MKKWLLAIALLLTFCYFLFLSACSLYVSIEGKAKKQAAAAIQPTAAPLPAATKPKTKTRYETLKEEHNKEWLNLPHRESENELFQPK